MTGKIWFIFMAFATAFFIANVHISSSTSEYSEIPKSKFSKYFSASLELKDPLFLPASAQSVGMNEPTAWDKAGPVRRVWGLIVAVPVFLIVGVICNRIGLVLRALFWTFGQHVEESMKPGCAQILGMWLLPLLIAYGCASMALDWALGGK